MNHGEIEGSFTVSLYHPCIVSLYYFIDWVSFSKMLILLNIGQIQMISLGVHCTALYIDAVNLTASFMLKQKLMHFGTLACLQEAVDW